MYKFLLIIGILVISIACKAQSFEFMPGTERIFIDAQYLKFFDQNYQWSLFSRARATTAYDENQTNLFTAAYLNRTIYKGFGLSLIGRIATSNSGIDLGAHYVYNNSWFSIFALLSINVGEDLLYSWFSIARFTPKISERWKMYGSIELFSSFQSEGHLASVQRIRLGLDWKAYQFGLAANLSQFGNDTVIPDENWGIFIRKQFK